jgi:hypothetical protein
MPVRDYFERANSPSASLGASKNTRVEKFSGWKAVPALAEGHLDALNALTSARKGNPLCPGDRLNRPGPTFAPG